MKQAQHADPLPDDIDTDFDPNDSPALQDEASISGSAPDPTSDDDTEEALEEVVGVEVEPGKPFRLADAVEKLEYDRRGIDPKDFDDEE
jgi:hypothetical protein